jgi:hypothetical protein
VVEEGGDDEPRGEDEDRHEVVAHEVVQAVQLPEKVISSHLHVRLIGLSINSACSINCSFH